MLFFYFTVVLVIGGIMMVYSSKRRHDSIDDILYELYDTHLVMNETIKTFEFKTNEITKIK
jgi:hypothetical protein